MDNQEKYIKRGQKYLDSNRGQGQIFDQHKLGSKSYIGFFGRQNMRNVIFDSSKENLAYDKARITGGHADLAQQYDNIVERVGRKNGVVSHFDEMSNVASRKIARDSMTTKGFAGYIGLNRDLSAATTPTRGGGIGNSFAQRNFETFSASRFMQHAERFTAFSMGAGMGTDMLNSVGLMTRHQKNIMRSNATTRGAKVTTAMGPALGALFAMNTASEYIDGTKESTLSDNAVTGVASGAASIAASTYAFRIAKEGTHAATSLVTPRVSGKMGKVVSAGKLITGTVAGLAAGLTAAVGVDTVTELARSSASQDNSILNLKRSLYKADDMADTSIQTNQLMTARQRTLNKLSKSSLNDRANLMGNEAMVLKGII